MATITDLAAGLPAASDFNDVEVPEFPRKYTKRQGPASTKKSSAGRTFSASGPKADLIARMIFADMKLTRSQMATIAKCSPSRVSEVVWALEDAKRKGIIEDFPEVPTKPPMDEAAEEADEPSEPQDDDVFQPENAADVHPDIVEMLQDNGKG